MKHTKHWVFLMWITKYMKKIYGMYSYWEAHVFRNQFWVPFIKSLMTKSTSSKIQLFSVYVYTFIMNVICKTVLLFIINRQNTKLDTSKSTREIWCKLYTLCCSSRWIWKTTKRIIIFESEEKRMTMLWCVDDENERKNENHNDGQQNDDDGDDERKWFVTFSTGR